MLNKNAIYIVMNFDEKYAQRDLDFSKCFGKQILRYDKLGVFHKASSKTRTEVSFTSLYSSTIYYVELESAYLLGDVVTT